jgi:hypothetical protein
MFNSKSAMQHATCNIYIYSTEYIYIYIYLHDIINTRVQYGVYIVIIDVFEIAVGLIVKATSVHLPPPTDALSIKKLLAKSESHQPENIHGVDFDDPLNTYQYLQFK